MDHQLIVLETQWSFSPRSGILGDPFANTDNLDREIGAPTVVFGPTVMSADGFHRQASARFWGRVAVRWREYLAPEQTRSDVHK